VKSKNIPLSRICLSDVGYLVAVLDGVHAGINGSLYAGVSTA